jgi:hypothetical protein
MIKRRQPLERNAFSSVVKSRSNHDRYSEWKLLGIMIVDHKQKSVEFPCNCVDGEKTSVGGVSTMLHARLVHVVIVGRTGHLARRDTQKSFSL